MRNVTRKNSRPRQSPDRPSCDGRPGGRTGQPRIVIRAARSSDAWALQRHCFPSQPLADVQSYLAWCECQAAKGRMVRLVAEVDGEAIANAQLTLRRDWAEIGGLVVAEAWRGRGIASRLIETLTEAARRHGARTLEIGAARSNRAVRCFYRRLGFVPYKEVELDFVRGDKWIVYMRKELE